MDKGFEHGSPSQIRRAIWATRGLFALLGVFSAVWGVHIPSVKQRYALGEGALSLVLVAAAVGAVSAVMFAGRVIGRLGARQTAMLCAVVMACMLGLVLHWPGLPWLLLAMLLFGASLSVFDVAINTEGSALEVAGGQPIMGSLHGMFSLGAMGGAALAAGMLGAGVLAEWQLLGVGVAVAVAIWIGARWMLPTPPPTDKPKVPFVSAQLDPYVGPVVASTDYMKAYAEQIRPFIPKGRTYKVLGTDGFGRSDFRSKLREHFEVNRHYIVVAALKALSEDGTVPVAKVAEAIAKYGINTDKVNPLYA